MHETTTTKANPVKTALTVKPRTRQRRTVENPGYAAFLRRALRAHGQRIATHGDPGDLRELLELTTHINQAINHAVTGLRDNGGYSWADIADQLGITKQAAQQRWG